MVVMGCGFIGLVLFVLFVKVACMFNIYTPFGVLPRTIYKNLSNASGTIKLVLLMEYYCTLYTI